MKYLTFLSLAAVALTALATSSASATTLEVSGVTQNSSVSITVTLEAGGSVTLSRTDGTLADTCTSAHTGGATSSPFTGTKVTGSWSSLTYSNCTNPVTVANKGQFYIEHISGTTEADLYAENSEITYATSLGFTVTCKTGEGTKMGRIKGVSSGSATIAVNAVLNCGFLLPSASWKGTLVVTSPAGFGISP